MTIDELEAKLASLNERKTELSRLCDERDKEYKATLHEWGKVYDEAKEIERLIDIEKAVAERLTKSL